MGHYDEERGWYKSGPNCPYDGEPCHSLHDHHVNPVGKMIYESEQSGEEINERKINSHLNRGTVFSCEHIGYCPEGRVGDEHARKRE